MAKIMLVEDDNNLREIYGARLMAEGYDIVAAKDGEEALAIAVKEKPDLIISDVMMPKISGFDMLDILRTTPETKNTKVIMMTALSQAEDKARADKLGADRYLVKSQVTLEDVAHVVREVLEGEATGGAPAADASAATNATPSATDTPAPEAAVAPAAPAPEPVAAAPAEPAAAPTVPPATTDATPPAPASNPGAAQSPAPAADPTVSAAPANATDTGLTLPTPQQPVTPPTVDTTTAPAVDSSDAQLIIDTPTESRAAPATDAPAAPAVPAASIDPATSAPVSEAAPSDTAGSVADTNIQLANQIASVQAATPAPATAPATAAPQDTPPETSTSQTQTVEMPMAPAPPKQDDSTPPARPGGGVDPNSIAL